MEEDIVFFKKIINGVVIIKRYRRIVYSYGFSNRVTSVKLHELAEKLERSDVY